MRTLGSNGGGASALVTPSPTDITTGNIAANNISATNVTTTNLAATTLSVGATSVVGIVSVATFGAKGDGVTDDTVAIQNALNSVISAGGTISLIPGAVHKTSSQLVIQGKNIIFDGNGATILFSPVAPITVTNKQALYVAGGVTGPFNCAAGAIALGATSFTAANASDAATLQPNDWVILWEKDNGPAQGGIAEVYFYDQYQVLSVSGTTVNLQQKVRTAFPGTHSTIQFSRISNLTHGITIRNLTVTSTYSVAVAPVVAGIYITLGARTTVIDNVVVNMPSGNAIATYLTADLKMVNSTLNSGNIQSTEFASTVDMLIDNNVWDSYNQIAARPPLTIDFGTAFSCFGHNTIKRAFNFGLGLFYGVHDCTFIGNTVSWITATGGNSGSGIAGTGCYNNTVVGNVLIGADGGASTGISFGDDTGAAPPVISHGNRVASNQIGSSFVYPTGLEAAPGENLDTYLELTTLGSQPLLKTGQVIQLSDLHNNNPFVRFTLTGQEFNISASAGLMSVSDVTNAGQLLQLSSLPGTAVYLFGWAVIRSILAGSRTVNPTDYTPNPIPAQGVSTFAISVPGANPVDEVALSCNPSPGTNLVWCGVATTDTVTVHVANPTTVAVTPVASSWRAIAVRHN